MENRKAPNITELVDLLGGKVATAYLSGASVPAVYKWLREGRVFHAEHALQLVKAANERGIPATFESVVRPANGHDTPSPRKKRARVRPSRWSGVKKATPSAVIVPSLCAA